MTHKHRHTLRALAAAAAACALAPPTASAVPVEQFLPSAGDRSASAPPPPSSIAASAAEEYEKLRSPDATTAPVRVVKVRADGRFDWGDAGIGATGALALVAIGAGGVFALGYWPRRRPVPQAIR